MIPHPCKAGDTLDFPLPSGHVVKFKVLRDTEIPDRSALYYCWAHPKSFQEIKPLTFKELTVIAAMTTAGVLWMWDVYQALRGRG